ncbi:MAG: sugar ABC transporter substrate-binding protein [Lachnospiraceae bacterium]|nr:sugar ABC transporter substrate-binding protein [Lachnospiraceae bacterium]
MKKCVAMLLTAAMVFSLVACGSSSSDTTTTTTEETEEEAAEETEEAEESTEAEETETASSGETVKVAFLTQSLSNASQAYAWTQFQAYAEEYGFEVTVFEEDYDAQNGASAIGTCISQGYAAICMNPTDPSALIPSIMEAREAGVLIGLYSSELPDGYDNTDYRDFMCGTDDYLFGQIAAQTLMEAFPDGANIVEVGGQSGHAAQINRHDGFMDEIEGSNITVLDSKDCEEWSSDDAMAIMEDFLVKYGDEIDAVYCHWDVGLTGCIEAIKAAGYDPTTIYSVGVDGCAIGFDQVKEGTQALCIGQSFSQMTIDAFDCITTLLAGEELESDVVWTEPQIITIDTVDDYPYPEW